MTSVIRDSHKGYFSSGCAWAALSNPASSLTKKRPRMGDGLIAFAFPPSVLRTAFGKPGILPRAKNCPLDSFSPGCAWVALSSPASSLTKKCPRVGAGLTAFAFPPTVLRTAFGKAGILPRAKNCPPDSFSPGCAWVALSNPISASKEQHPCGGAALLAERVGFEPTVGCPITSFQDWLLKPLGHLSGYRKTAETAVICGGVRGI